MNVFAALAVLALLIVVHEAGHFFAATLQGIRVSGFSIGFGPALIKHEHKGVTYAIRMLPLGGFVMFPDDEEDSSVPADDPDLMRNRPIHQRAMSGGRCDRQSVVSPCGPFRSGGVGRSSC